MKKRKTTKSNKFKKQVSNEAQKLVFRDGRLDKIMPILTEILTKLLGSAGMVRYRKDFTDKVKEIMNEKETEVDTKTTKVSG